ncbi:ATP-dependent (S)-NAD(P)H-hydrate dehydratase [Balamuthia mandrillaris]
MSAKHRALIEEAVNMVPPLSPKMYKGQAGKIAVVGGSFEYTGAPWYAGISALRLGADLSHIFCCENAATAIKAYSPELIVHPLLPSSPTISSRQEELTEEQSESLVSKSVEKVEAWLPKFNSVVVGPGLGRDPITLRCASAIIRSARQQGIPLVIDGDAISAIVCPEPDIIRGYRLAVLTPNKPEFERLCDSVLSSSGKGDEEQKNSKHTVKELAKGLGNVLVVQKGQTDRISDGSEEAVECSTESGLRRFGGQGDILAGAVATFLAWSQREGQNESASNSNSNKLVSAVYAACHITRRSSRKAFEKYGRGSHTTAMIGELTPSLEELLDSPTTASTSSSSPTPSSL